MKCSRTLQTYTNLIGITFNCGIAMNEVVMMTETLQFYLIPIQILHLWVQHAKELLCGHVTATMDTRPGRVTLPLCNNRTRQILGDGSKAINSCD